MANPKAVRFGITVFFIGLLAAPRVGSMLIKEEPAGGDGGQFGFQFKEVSKASGIDFVHQAPTLDAKLAPIMEEIASMGAGLSVADFDRDGWNDLYLVNSGEGSKNRLYRNLGNGKFEDVAGKLGVADLNQPETGVSMGAIWGDYDNDGFEDLVVYKWGRPELFHNDGGKGFTRVTETAGLPSWINGNSAVWFDYDRDGNLDLFLGGYYPENVNLWKLQNTRMMPDSFEYAQNGGRKYLFRNLGNGKFQDVTEQVGLKSRRWALAAAAADLRGTGYPDLMIANDYGVSELFANEGGKRFREMAKETGIAERPKSGMNVAFGDIHNEGQFSIYISNITEEGKLLQGNNLWVPQPGGLGAGVRYVNEAASLGVERGGWSFGSQFGDLNNDGMQDLFLTNGYVSGSNGDYWYDFSKISGGSGGIIGDAKNWPPVNGRDHSGHQQKRVWMNEGGKRFVDVAAFVGVNETFDGRAVAMADFGNRGALDVVVAHQKGPVLLYQNSVKKDNRWVDFELEGAGPAAGGSNRSAIGAEVRVFWNGQQQLQQVSGASGFCAQNQRRLHFGLGKDGKVDKVVIRWPTGKQQTVNAPEIGKLHHIKEPV